MDNGQAYANLKALAKNPYPGRGIVIALSETARFLILAYWIMGRKLGSRNRVFEREGNRVFTELADPKKFEGSPEELELLLYNAMRETDDRFVVSNGNQTDTIVTALENGNSFRDALDAREFEPDPPNFTPRISAICSLKDGSPMVEFGILSKSPYGQMCNRSYFAFERLAPGIGLCVTTYTGDGSPLPAFTGVPYPLPFHTNTAEAFAETLWSCLNEENRVSLVVKFVHLGSRTTSHITIKNKYTKVA